MLFQLRSDLPVDHWYIVSVHEEVRGATMDVCFQ